MKNGEKELKKNLNWCSPGSSGLPCSATTLSLLEENYLLKITGNLS